ncbi:gluconokinase [Halanaerobium saccharolyticum]|uniref:Gluconokinase n=1 Tax=Halanaerobium saccharolyticum TaxID=43595 RepID=A0A4R6M1F4_9FIRM|nr:FGGY family carbohydrate kinase [Halanaerobium saccharolyticum]TDO94190.1 gluconokinase [Halanaerobium saccharolyticum]
MYILALEFSTSAVKVTLFSQEKGIIKNLSKNYDDTIGNMERQSAEELYKFLIKTAAKLINGFTKAEKNKIELITLVSTWHSFLVLDQDRKPITDILTWADTSAGETVLKYRENKKISQTVYQKTGCPVHSIYPLWKFIHLDKSSLKFERLSISSKPEYIFEKLTKRRAISLASASGTGLFNINNLNWDQDILDFAGLSSEQLSPLKEYDFRASLSKKAAQKLDLKSGLPVLLPGPDGAFNQIAAGGLKSKIMTLSVGTSGALRVTSDKAKIPDQPSTWCYYGAEGKRIVGAATSGAGNCTQWFKKKIKENNSNFAELEKSIEDLNKKEAPIFLPFIYGERCPGWQDKRKAQFCEIKGSHFSADLYYAVLEGVLFNLYQSYLIIEEMGLKPEKIRISGGITNSEKWLQMAADIFGRKLIVSNFKDSSTMGSIILGLNALGLIDKLSDYQPEEGKVIDFNSDRHQFYQSRFEKYKYWYQKTI